MLLVPLVLLASQSQPATATIRPLPTSVRAELKHGGFWHKGCPVSLSDLRVLTVRYIGFDGHVHTGQLVVNRAAGPPLAKVFRQLRRLHFRIHYMRLADMYGSKKSRPADDDVSGSFECRNAVPSPCSGGNSTGNWSMHAYGLAVDINPTENPYVGCGATRHPESRPYLDRSHHREGMVTRRVIGAFASIGWGWGGSWAGSTKDYMHFSSTGH